MEGKSDHRGAHRVLPNSVMNLSTGRNSDRLHLETGDFRARVPGEVS